MSFCVFYYYWGHLLLWYGRDDFASYIYIAIIYHNIKTSLLYHFLSLIFFSFVQRNSI